MVRRQDVNASLLCLSFHTGEVILSVVSINIYMLILN